MKSPTYKTNTVDEFFYDESFEDFVDDGDFKKAVDVMCYFLKKDESLYFAYQANIAMAFVDEFNESIAAAPHTHEDVDILHVANNAAKVFLDRLIDR